MEMLERLRKFASFLKAMLVKVRYKIFPEIETQENIRYPEFLLLTKFMNLGYCLLLVPFKIRKDVTTGRYQLSSSLLHKVCSKTQHCQFFRKGGKKLNYKN